VSAGLHPAGVEASALGHLLGPDATVPSDRGLFLPLSYRMHAAIARFVSELMYEGRLAGDPACNRQRIIAPGSGLDGAGLRTLALAHTGCSNASQVEADAIASALGRLAGARLVDMRGDERPLDLARDAIVVAPYNAQVALVRATLAAHGLGNVRVGTVDKFQGQEAPIVFYSMTTSSGDDVPRDVEFLFDRHRLNVAISRARALAIVVHSTALLELRPATVDQMRLVNALALFGELAEPAAGRPPA
jgi:superfamily I DNA and/or RNA helicase